MKTLFLFCLAAAVGGWYFFVDTVSFRDLVGRPQGSFETIFVNLVDFDTGLTRYDIYRLKERAPYWNRRINEVDSIRDPRKRNEEQTRLVADMTEDPVLRKISKRVFGRGADLALSLLRAIN